MGRLEVHVMTLAGLERAGPDRFGGPALVRFGISAVASRVCNDDSWTFGFGHMLRSGTRR